MQIPYETVLNTLKDTKILAGKLAHILNKSDLIVLDGDLGSGKTTLVKDICSFYGINDVTSPSFSIVNEYLGTRKVFHFDFYRIKTIDELYDIGFEDYLNKSESIIFIEWGYLIKDIIPTDHYFVELKLMDLEKRYFRITKNF